MRSTESVRVARISMCPSCQNSSFNENVGRCDLCEFKMKVNVIPDDRVWLTVRKDNRRRTGIFLSETGARLHCATHEEIEVHQLATYAKSDQASGRAA